jgi:hypothetical protein
MREKAIVKGMLGRGMGRRNRTTQERPDWRAVWQMIPLTIIPLTASNSSFALIPKKREAK